MFYLLCQVLLICLIYDMPIYILAVLRPLRYPHQLSTKKDGLCWPIIYIGRNTCPMAATSGFCDSPGPPTLGNVLGIVLADRHGHFFFFFSAWDPVVRRGNMAWVLNQRRCSVAPIEALDPLHWSMYSLLYRRISMAVEVAQTEVDSFVVDNFVINLTVAN